MKLAVKNKTPENNQPKESVSSRLFDIADSLDEVKKASLFLGHATTTEHNYSDFMKFGAQVCFDMLADRMSVLCEQLYSIHPEIQNLESTP